MILFSAKKSAVHSMHLTAVAAYAQAHNLKTSPSLMAFSAIGPLCSSSDAVVFSQATGAASLLVLPLARMLGKRVVHYMHEPTPLRRKLRENPWVKSLLWHGVQWVEMRVANRVMVSRPELLEQAAEIYGVSRDKITLAPLLMPAVSSPEGAARTRITYLGRIDERRYFREFLDRSSDLARRGFTPTILTGDSGALGKYSAELPTDVEMFSEPNFSEKLKARILSETLCLWNPKRGEIAQSGVTADAIRFGVAILLTDKDPSFHMLISAGIALDFREQMQRGFTGLEAISPSSVRLQAASLFSETHGPRAFIRSYLPEVS